MGHYFFPRIIYHLIIINESNLTFRSKFNFASCGISIVFISAYQNLVTFSLHSRDLVREYPTSVDASEIEKKKEISNHHPVFEKKKYL